MKRIKHSPGFTLIEILVVVAVVVALAAIGSSLYRSSKEKANQSAALQKMKSLGAAFVSYTVDTNGTLPAEDSYGTDDWVSAARPENQQAWYNALPKLMGAKSVGELGQTNPAGLYDPNHPLYIPGAPYPGPNKRLDKPTFAVAMNSRLQRRGEDGLKVEGKLELIQEPAKTVILFERGMPNDKKTMPAQSGFDGTPKGNAGAFAARHNQKGTLIFADGHAELKFASELLTVGGGIIVPQTSIVWTMNPDDDPN
jgi:prepilin-type N-terminal cleavage/methylation domain-containing protein/prepilin-type processing-associated H-X9-DG protein